MLDAPMQRSPSSCPACVLERFPKKAILIRQLLLSNLEFRSICEDYAAALNTLAHFKARPDAAERPEVADFEGLICELEAELVAALETSGDPGAGCPVSEAGLPWDEKGWK